ncbi:EF-Tu/IF-2/RF-3 family GTPase [Streptomyces sp. NPDC054842]
MSAVSRPFLMPVEDVFPLRQGRSVMATGLVERGRVRTGDEVEVVGSGAGALARVGGIRLGAQHVEEAGEGSNLGLLLPGSVTSALERGQVLAAPGSIGAHAVFTADIVLLPEAEGGTELPTGGVLWCHLRFTAVAGTVTLPPGLDTPAPLHVAAVTIGLERAVPLEEGQRFAFRLRGRAAGSGTVTGLSREVGGPAA